MRFTKTSPVTRDRFVLPTSVIVAFAVALTPDCRKRTHWLVALTSYVTAVPVHPANPETVIVPPPLCPVKAG